MCHATSDVPWSVAEGLHEDDIVIDAPNGPVPSLRIQQSGSTADNPAVVVIPDIFGRTRFYEDVCRRLAAEGYVAILPDYFHRVGPLPGRGLEAARARRRHLDEATAVEELEQAVAWLRREPFHRRVAAIGFCVGGTFALHLAMDVEGLPVVCYYGYPGSSPRGGDRAIVAPLDRPPVLRSPLMGFWGAEDSGVGIDNVRRFERLAREAGSDIDVQIYPGAGHGFLRRLDAEGNDADARAACDSWCRTLSFLAHTLSTADEPRDS